uniref:(northern house mosquito) hypothetical protein n=1 Tax=Culex pipiens TaxID=7175 RepID=A0A8D8HE84_CULPI
MPVRNLLMRKTILTKNLKRCWKSMTDPRMKFTDCSPDAIQRKLTVIDWRLKQNVQPLPPQKPKRICGNCKKKPLACRKHATEQQCSLDAPRNWKIKQKKMSILSVKDLIKRKPTYVEPKQRKKTSKQKSRDLHTSWIGPTTAILSRPLRWTLLKKRQHGIV